VVWRAEWTRRRIYRKQSCTRAKREKRKSERNRSVRYVVGTEKPRRSYVYGSLSTLCSNSYILFTDRPFTRIYYPRNSGDKWASYARNAKYVNNEGRTIRVVNTEGKILMRH